MLRESHLELVRTRGSKFGRVLMGLLFFVSALNVFLSPGGTTGTANYFTSLGIPMASVVVWVVIILMFVAGGAIIIGKRTTEASAVLIILILIATLIAYRNFADTVHMTEALKNLAIVGGLLYLMAFGPGGMNVKGQEV